MSQQQISTGHRDRWRSHRRGQLAVTRTRILLAATLLLAASCAQADDVQADETATSVQENTSTTPTDANRPTASSVLDGPPPLLIVSPEEAVEAAPRGSCWADMCSDYAQQVPPIVTTGGPVMLTFAVDNWDFEIVADNGCVSGTFDLEKTEDRTWKLTWTGPPGRRAFEARGSGPEGSAAFSFAVEATVGIGIDVPRGGFRGFYSEAETPPSPELVLRLSSSDPELVTPKSIVLTITGTDGRTAQVPVIDRVPGGECISRYQINGFATIDIIDEIGLGIWSYTFVLESNDGRWFKAGFGSRDPREPTDDALTALKFAPIDPP